MKRAMASARRRGAAGGFTLLEVVVALVVLGLLMVGLTQGVRAGLALGRAQATRIAATAELDASMRLLRGLLGHMPLEPTRARVVTTAAGEGLKGDAHRLRFVGDLPTGLGATRRADIRIYRRGAQLVLAWTPHYHDRPLVPAKPPTETVLLEGLKELDFAYWGSPVRGQPAAWRSEWDGAEAPELVRLRLVFPKGDRRRWPDLVAAPRP